MGWQVYTSGGAEKQDTGDQARAYGGNRGTGNRGLFGASAKGRRSQGVLQHDYLGYNSPGDKSETILANNYKLYAKRIVPPRSGLLTSIDLYCNGNAANVQVIYPGLHKDNAGTPGILLGGFAAETAASGQILSVVLDTSPRWFAVPVGIWLEGGVPVWLNLRAGYALTVFYSDGGNDYEQAINDTWLRDAPAAATYTRAEKSFCIRGSFVF